MAYRFNTYIIHLFINLSRVAKFAGVWNDGSVIIDSIGGLTGGFDKFDKNKKSVVYWV
jgi:hypothetical protein